MKINNTKIKIVLDQLSNMGHAYVIEYTDQTVDEHSLRKFVHDALTIANHEQQKKIVMTACGYSAGFPVIGSAKICTQEVLKFCKRKDCQVETITFCLEDDQVYQEFDRQVTGYINHVQTHLGLEPYVTVDIIIEYGDGIVIIERSNPPYGWALPGGFLDPGESVEVAAIREAKEETHLDLEDLKQFHTYSDPKRDPRFHTVSTVFIAKGIGDAKSGDDAQDLKVVKFDELLDGEYAFDHKQVIEDYLKGRI